MQLCGARAQPIHPGSQLASPRFAKQRLGTEASTDSPSTTSTPSSSSSSSSPSSPSSTPTNSAPAGAAAVSVPPSVAIPPRGGGVGGRVCGGVEGGGASGERGVPLSGGRVGAQVEGPEGELRLERAHIQLGPRASGGEQLLQHLGPENKRGTHVSLRYEFR